MFIMVEIIWTLISDAIMELSAQLTIRKSFGPKVHGYVSYPEVSGPSKTITNAMLISAFKRRVAS
jgi:hypothetical protein